MNTIGMKFSAESVDRQIAPQRKHRECLLAMMLIKLELENIDDGFDAEAAS